jgi:hypothetical protein
MTFIEASLEQFAALEALQNQRQNLVETIDRPMDIMNSMLAGKLRARLLDQISCLDAILEVMKRLLETLAGSPQKKSDLNSLHAIIFPFSLIWRLSSSSIPACLLVS